MGDEARASDEQQRSRKEFEMTRERDIEAGLTECTNAASEGARRQEPAPSKIANNCGDCAGGCCLFCIVPCFGGLLVCTAIGCYLARFIMFLMMLSDAILRF